MDPKGGERFRFWRGTIVGQTVSHVWSSYAWCLFFEFGPLTPGEYFVDRRGGQRQFQPEGEWSITTMESWPSWTLSKQGVLLASSDDRSSVRDHALRRLIGRRLKSLEIDERPKSTRLTFSWASVLETRTEFGHYRGKPHWLLRAPETRPDHWPAISLDTQ